MKLTKREKILIGILGSILVIMSIYQFLLKPRIERATALKEEIKTHELKMKAISQEIKTDNKIQEKYKILNAQIYEGSKPYFPSLIQEKFIVLLDEILEETNIQGQILSFSDPESDIFEEKKEEIEEKSDFLTELVKQYKEGVSILKDEEDQKKEEKPKDDKPIRVEKMSVNINFEGDYQDVLDFMDKLESLNRAIYIKNLNLYQQVEQGLAGNMILEFYAIPKINDQDEEFLTWPLENIYGKNNPFAGGYRTMASPKKESKEIKTYDFAMNVKPINSDLPTIILGKTKDASKNTYVYADKNTIEDVEIYFLQEQGNYYYKYKTSRDTYPNDFQEFAAFVPHEDPITLLIYSHPRNSAEDLSGAMLHIFNQTDRRLYIKIINDDSERPRVNVSTKKGEVDIDK
ncbi:hypothetical protein QBE52_10075 [Clostridiaceae bacterium 35-E11]